MAGMASAQLLIMALALGANKLPAGASGSLDSVVERAAPEKCLLYYSSTPVAKAKVDSKNHAEQILADEGVQNFFAELKTQFSSAIRQAADVNPELAAIEQLGVTNMLEIAITRPAALYIERMAISRHAPPDVVAGLVVDCGDRVEDLRESIDKIVELAQERGQVELEDVTVSGAKLRRLTKDEVVVDFGFREAVFILTVGKEASADLLTRLDRAGATPDWLTGLKAKAKIDRVSNVFYVCGAQIREAIEPLLTEPKVRSFLASIGVDRFVSMGSVGGLADDGIVSRQFLDVGGWPADWPASKPLTADDLKPIPDNAELASAARLDVGWFYRHLIDVLDPLVPADGANDDNDDDDADTSAHTLKDKIAEAEEKLGFKIEDGLLAALGDVWTFHSTGGGAMPASGFVLTVTVRDPDQLMKVHQKILDLVNEQLEKQDDVPFSIETKDVRGIKAFHIQPRGPIVLDPAWAVVDGRLVVSATLQGLKSHVARDGKKSLGKLPAVAARLQSGPIAIGYQDTLTALRQMISTLQTVGPIAIGQLSQLGIHIEMPTLPDLEPIESHILPRIDTTRWTKEGLESESFSTVPFAVNSGKSPVPAARLAHEAPRSRRPAIVGGAAKALGLPRLELEGAGTVGVLTNAR